MKTISHMLVTAASLGVAVWLIGGIGVDGESLMSRALTLVGVAVIFGLVNALIKPVFTVMTGCLVVLTLGLFLLVINGLMLMCTSWLSGLVGLGFHVDGFWPALWGSIVISIASAIMNSVLNLDLDEG